MKKTRLDHLQPKDGACYLIKITNVEVRQHQYKGLGDWLNQETGTDLSNFSTT